MRIKERDMQTLSDQLERERQKHDHQVRDIENLKDKKAEL